MINELTLNHQPRLVLESDMAGEFPLYLYYPQDHSILLYTTSITELLKDARVTKPLKVSTKGLSFLLQSGVVPPPQTVYQDIYILGIGDKAEVSALNGRIDIKFIHKFPFLNVQRLQADEMQPDENLILQMIAEATISRIHESKPSFLFHSAGKDSNSIALALAEAGLQDKVTLITHRSKGPEDESEISAIIAKQLGFKHQILHEVDQLQAEHKQAVNDYFINAPFPCTDNVTLAYPLYTRQLPELKGANIIDGGGNDSYMMTPPSRAELKALRRSKFTHHASSIRKYIKSENYISVLVQTQAEWFGMSGLSYADTKNIYPFAISAYDHWINVSRSRNNWDVVDFKTSILTPIVASEMHIRKVRNFADSVCSNMILPFANQRVAEYFAKMPEKHLFDRKSLHNKIILRKILKDRVSLDSDAIGKMGYSYDSRSLVLLNWDWMLKEMLQCKLWHKSALINVVNRLKIAMQSDSKSANLSGRLIYRLFLISGWHNNNRYLSREGLHNHH